MYMPWKKQAYTIRIETDWNEYDDKLKSENILKFGNARLSQCRVEPVGNYTPPPGGKLVASPN